MRVYLLIGQTRLACAYLSHLIGISRVHLVNKYLDFARHLFASNFCHRCVLVKFHIWNILTSTSWKLLLPFKCMVFCGSQTLARSSTVFCIFLLSGRHPFFTFSFLCFIQLWRFWPLFPPSLNYDFAFSCDCDFASLLQIFPLSCLFVSSSFPQQNFGESQTAVGMS